MARPHSGKAQTMKIFASHVNAQRESTVEKVSNQIDRMTKCSGDISQPLSQPLQRSFNAPMNKEPWGQGWRLFRGLASSMDFPLQ